MGENSIYLCAVIFISIAACVIGDGMECDKYMPRKAFAALREQGTVYPDKTQLAAICPGFILFLKCYSQAINENPGDFDEDNLVIFQRIRNTFSDVCAADGKFRRAYLSNVDCFRKTEANEPSCRSASQEGYNLYKLLNATRLPKEEECFGQAHKTACMAVHILKTCGPRGLSIQKNFIKKSRTFADVCEGKTAEALGTNYLDSLHQDEEVRNIFKEVFRLGL